MDVIEIVKTWLKENNFDDLCNAECSCVKDFVPCDGGPGHTGLVKLQRHASWVQANT